MIFLTDEPEMWLDSVPLRTRVDLATMCARSFREGDNRRDTAMVVLSAAGKIGATFRIHHQQRMRQIGSQTVVVEKAVSWNGHETNAGMECRIY
jgi:hypothetical protein